MDECKPCLWKGGLSASWGQSVGLFIKRREDCGIDLMYIRLYTLDYIIAFGYIMSVPDDKNFLVICDQGIPCATFSAMLNEKFCV